MKLLNTNCDNMLEFRKPIERLGNKETLNKEFAKRKIEEKKQQDFLKYFKRYSPKFVSPTWYKDLIDPKLYSFENSESHIYGDFPKGSKKPIINPIFNLTKRKPHLILKDKIGQKRYTLQYEELAEENKIIINTIQRVRTQYIETKDRITQKESYLWSKELEQKSETDFLKELKMHPAIFLISEFISQFKTKINLGTKIYLDLNRINFLIGVDKNYLLIINLFFKQIDNSNIYELDLNKPRVKALLSNNYNLPTELFTDRNR